MVVNFILFHGFNHCQFQSLCWKPMPNTGKSCVETFFSFGDRNRNVHEWERLNLVTTCDWHLALPCDIRHQLHDLNTKHHGLQKLISDMSGIAKASEIKVKLFWKHLENSNLCNFSSCDLLHKDGSMCSLPKCPSYRNHWFLDWEFKKEIQ
jgi:hypothetical protein